MKLSDALASTQTALLASQFAGGEIRLFSGPPPASPDQAQSGTPLGVVTVDAIAGAGLHFVASGPVLQKADETWAFRALASGRLGWWRLVQSGDTGGNDMAALRIDGTVGTLAAPGDMNWESLDVANGLFYTQDDFVYFIHPVGA